MNAGMVQVRASFSVGVMPAFERSTPAYYAALRDVAERYAERYGAPIHEPPHYEVDAETDAALEAWRDGMPLMLRASVLDFAPEIPLRFHHVPTVLAESLEVGVRGSEFVLTGWVPESMGPALAQSQFCSPGIAFRKARIVEIAPSVEWVDTKDAVLYELSVADAPRLDGTAFSVGRTPGKRYWADPSEADSERFTQSNTGVIQFSSQGAL